MTRDQVLVASFAALQILVAVVWATLAGLLWRLPGTAGRPRGLLAPLVMASTLASCGYLIGAVLTLSPPAVHASRPLWLRLVYVAGSVCFIGFLAGFGHMALGLPVGAPRPGRRRLAALYGSAMAVLLLDASAWFPAVPSPRLAMLDAVVHGGWVVVVLGAVGWRIARNARSGAWNPDTVFVVRRRDVMVIGALVLAAAFMFTLVARGGWAVYPWALNSVNVAVGLAAAVPFAARALGAVLRTVLLATAALVLTGIIFALAQLVLLPRVDPSLSALVHVLTVVAIVGLLLPGHRWLGAAIDTLLLRRRRRQLVELQALMRPLSPELGRLGCSRAFLAGLVRVLGLRGAAVILRDGTALAEGTVDVVPIAAAWPRDAAADAFPTRLFFGHDVATGDLRDLLVEQRIAAVVPIVSPQNRWGDILVSTGAMGTAFAEEDIAILDTVTQQLGLLLDATLLLERAVAVERSLAQAEKLAAIGETAARIAHDIRNPVAAARSLTQQLASESAGSSHAELVVILEELDRVERRVADLLQFARRDEMRFESVDLGVLARATLAQLRPRLEAAGVTVVLDLASGAMACADRERVRQLLVNLVENAADALSGAPRRELAICVATTNGGVTLRVSDTGPGVPADVLPRLFEPFFSQKPHGTGLGLAIAKRTADAHGGRITASLRPEGGMIFDVGLPLAGADAG